MARQPFRPRGPTPSNAHFYAAFIGDLLDGTVQASALVETRDVSGRVTGLSYDEPAPRPAVSAASVATEPSKPVQKRGGKAPQKPRGSR